MSRVSKYDYKALEQIYIMGDMSIRDLCRQNEITTWSTVATQAKKLQWERKRAEYREKLHQHTIEAFAERRAQKMAQLMDDAIDVLDAAILKVADDMRRPDYVIPSSVLVEFIKQVQLLTGGPTSREEHHNLDFHAELPAELLRDLQAAARAKGAGPVSVGQSALPLIEGARKVN